MTPIVVRGIEVKMCINGTVNSAKRSYTCILKALNEPCEDGYRITSLRVNCDPEQYGCTDKIKDVYKFQALLVQEYSGDAGEYWE